MSSRYEAIPRSVRAFLLRHFDSVELLEVFFLLRRNQSRAWTVADLNAELRSDLDSIAKRIDDLLRKKLITANCNEEAPSYRYRLQAERCEGIITQLDHFYSQRRVTIIDMIFSRPRSNILMLSDAFKYRKD